MIRVTNQSKQNAKGMIGELLEKKILITKGPHHWVTKPQNSKFLSIVFDRVYTIYLVYQDFNKVSHDVLLDRMERHELDVQLGGFVITELQCHSMLINGPSY